MATPLMFSGGPEGRAFLFKPPLLSDTEMVLASHVIISAYGFWRPNDERGSWSDFVRCYELLQFGPATKLSSPRSTASEPFDASRRDTAKAALRYNPVVFSGIQANCIANAFADGVKRSAYVIYACSILPDHVHLVVRRHRYKVEQVSNRLKGSATRYLTEAGLHPMVGQFAAATLLPSPWSEGQWKVFLDSPEAIRRAIDYVDENPEKQGKKRQGWKFVTPYGH